MIKYRVRWWNEPDIRSFAVEKETDKCVWINGKRRAKKSWKDEYFDTFDGAKENLISVFASKLIVAERALESSRSNLQKAKKLEPPQ